MARVTIEDCLQCVENMYELVHLATKRARQLYKGAEPLVKSKNRIIVTSLREIAAKKVRPLYDKQSAEGDDGWIERNIRPLFDPRRRDQHDKRKSTDHRGIGRTALPSRSQQTFINNKRDRV